MDIFYFIPLHSNHRLDLTIQIIYFRDSIIGRFMGGVSTKWLLNTNFSSWWVKILSQSQSRYLSGDWGNTWYVIVECIYIDTNRQNVQQKKNNVKFLLIELLECRALQSLYEVSYMYTPPPAPSSLDCCSAVLSFWNQELIFFCSFCVKGTLAPLAYVGTSLVITQTWIWIDNNLSCTILK
jgi:hypothetical protein